MGFLDKAKKMAEQAQQKVEEQQSKFNQSQAQKAGQGGAAGPATTFDQQGRPVAPTTTDPTAPLEGGDPQGGPPVGETPPAQAPEEAPQVTPPAEDPALKEGVNKSPDPFKPLS